MGSLAPVEEDPTIWKVIFALAWLFIEGSGLPLLSEGAFGPLAAAVAQGVLGIWPAYLLAWAATIAGNTVGFLAFSYYGPALVRWLARFWPRLDSLRRQAEPWVRRHIFWAITLSRFVGLGTFGVVLWLAAILGARRTRFLPYLYVLNLVWTALWLFGSTWLVKEALPYLEGRTPLELLLLGGGALLAIWVVHRCLAWLGQVLRKGENPL